ncbi:MAG TPA: MarR family transcriptional regulator [Sphingomonas sp.]|nr:MarR family transcriptional regulator [Sphingomonas sp.]
MSRPHQLETLIGYHLRRASSLMMSDLAERLAELGLRTTEASILVVLEAETLITQSEIGRRLAIKRANMAPLIAGLTTRALVERTEGAGPSKPLRLSHKGKLLAAKARTAMDEHEAVHFGRLSPAEREMLRSILDSLWRQPKGNSPI